MSEIPQTINTIGVIVGRDLVGDALIKLPFLRALRNAWPQAEIHWITSQGPTAYGGVLRDATRGLIDEVEECPEWVQSSGLRAQQSKIPDPRTPNPGPFFDLLIDTRGRWRTTLEARKIPHGLFIAHAMRYLFSEKRPGLLQPRPAHLVNRLLQMVELAAGYLPPSTGALPVPQNLLLKAQYMLPDGKVYVGLAPGAGNSVKIWPRYKFEKVASAQAAKGRVPVFILGPRELAAHDTLAAAVPEAKFPLQDYETWGSLQLGVEQTLAVAKCLSVAVANDSGVGHMLAAVDCPLISLFGPTDPAKLAPRVTRGKIIRAQNFGSAQMSAITWESVNDAVEEMLKHS
jgi:ADP-heptose:LPS heptosyltransferase